MRLRLVSTLVACVALLATACGGGDSGGGEGSQLRVAGSVPIVSLDAHGEQSADQGLQTAVAHILDALVRAESPTEYAPALAKSWKTPDPRTWVFTLRDDVTFHDGTPFTAKDVEASLEHLIELGGPLVPLWEQLDEIEATGEHTVTITTKTPMGTVLSALSLLYIAPADRVNDPDYWNQPVGTGAFEVSEFLPNERLVLTRNADYWGKAPKLRRLEFVEIPEISSRLTALETGEIDVTWGIPPDQISAVRENPDLVYESIAGYNYNFVWFNSGEEPFDDARVRRAMWHAVDIESAVEDLYGESAEVARAPIPQAAFGAPEMRPYEYDPAKAEQLLADAGYPDGFETALQWSDDGGATIRSLAETFISDWAEIGVRVKPQEKERGQWIDDLNNMRWKMNIQGNSVNTGDADYTLGRLYLCSAGRTGFCDDELDELILQGRESIDEGEREQAYTKASEIIWNEAVGIFPMDIRSNGAWRANVKGFELQPVYNRFHDVTVD